MKVLVACEYSGIVRDAFIRAGHDAMSADLLPTESPGPHHEGDVMDVLGEGWDLMVAHPPCTYLANSGVRWLHERPGRWAELDDAAAFFRELLEADIPRIAVENPVPHKYAVERIGRKYDQTIQPWQFGHGETKRTCLWLKNLPPLEPTDIVEGREARVHRMAPGPDRQKERSRFFTGVAEAMADQWGVHPRGRRGGRMSGAREHPAVEPLMQALSEAATCESYTLTRQKVVEAADAIAAAAVRAVRQEVDRSQFSVPSPIRQKE